MFAHTEDYPTAFFGFLPMFGGSLEAPTDIPTVFVTVMGSNLVRVFADPTTHPLIEFDIQLAP